METRKPLNARVWRLWEWTTLGILVAQRGLGQELTDWKEGQVRWAKIAEPSPNAPYCAALCGLIGLE